MNKDTPTFKAIFGHQWNALPPVMRIHYQNRPFSDDVLTVEGIMNVERSWLAVMFSPLFQLIGTLVPHQAKNVPVTVHYRSEKNSARFCFDRTFHFTDRAPHHFFSRMLQIKDNIVVEFMRFGIGWRIRYEWDGEKVMLHHAGYVWKLFRALIPLPIEWVLGTAYAEEVPLSENRFYMKMEIMHPLFGKVYGYDGEFRIVS
ncbi:MAG: DUF4166 domain-containing protein [Hyphomicrobiales bacterium]|nr:DUF4166 domain-containing protein [Rickettsiales bacterium]MCP5361146.1 DUF4166 domain-containing protein [Hyphomicrobiales bacterium]